MDRFEIMSSCIRSAATHCGSKDYDRHGNRPLYQEKEYIAFLHDPDGREIETVYDSTHTNVRKY